MVVRKKYTPLLLVLLSGFFLGSCDSKRFYEENVLISGGIWKSTEPASFNFTIDNTGTPYSVFLNVRNAPDYPYSNLFLFLTTRYPDGKLSRDTLELTLTDLDGRWLGSGIGSLKFSRFLLKKEVYFPQKGIYGIRIEQAMRTGNLKGIHDIGLRLEKQ